MEYIKYLRSKGIRTVIAAAIFIVIIMGINSYLDIQQDTELAHRLMERELEIADRGIEWELHDVEVAIKELEENALLQLDYPDKMYDITLELTKRSDFIKAVGIGFTPYYYPEKGQWFEPRCIRHDSLLVKEQGGGPHHDYFRLEWYRNVSSDNLRSPVWTAPYTDHSQDNTVVMTLSSPLYDGSGRMAAVMGIDVSLLSLHKLLKSIEPYPGSICQLLDNEGRLMVSSSESDLNSKDFFIVQTAVSYSHSLINDTLVTASNLQVRLGIPKSVVYGPAAQQNLISLVMMMVGLLLLTLIVQRSLHNYVKLNEARQQQQTVDNEMRIAHDIQMNMLRNDFPPSLYATLQPMKEVGGDLYDFYQRDDTLFFIIGDVSGKGLPAAMMMAGTVAAFRMATRHYDTPVEIVSEINHVISERNPDLIFITAFVGKLDMSHGLLTYCNAGHNPPVLNGTLLDTDPDIPIGYNADYAYRQYGAVFGKGSRMVLYTDGITEARNSGRKFFGTSRLLSVISRHGTDDIATLTNAVIQATRQFAGNANPIDDMTLMSIFNDVATLSPAITISNDTEELARVKPLLREYCQCLDCDRRTIRNILIAIEEALSNVISYAYPKGELGSIEIDILAKPAVGKEQKGYITVVITDRGTPFNPLAHQTDNVEQATRNRQVGGLGIYLYHQLMDCVDYQRTDDGRNVLILTKQITLNKQ